MVEETFVIKRPEVSQMKKDLKKLTTLADLSFAFVITTISAFALACIFFLVQAIVSGPHTHSSNAHEVDVYINQIKNFWPVILGGCLFGLGFIMMFAKLMVQLVEIPLLRRFSEASEVRAVFSRYQNWTDAGIAAWLSFNILIGTITDNNIVRFCHAHLNLLNKIK